MNSSMTPSSSQSQVIRTKNCINPLLPSCTNHKKLTSSTSNNWIMNILQKITQSNSTSINCIRNKPKTSINKARPIIPKESKVIVKNSRNFKFGLRLKSDCFRDTNLKLQTQFLIMLDQAINRSNLKINFLDASIARHTYDLTSNRFIIKFYQRLKRHGNVLENLKLNLWSNTTDNRISSNFAHEKLIAIKFALVKLTNIKVLNLNIRLNSLYYIEGSNALNLLYQQIGLYLNDLRSLEFTLASETFDTVIPFRLTINWECIEKLKNLISFSLKLKKGNFICSKSNIMSLLEIIHKHPKLKKYHMSISNQNASINLAPLKNLTKYFEYIKELESLKINVPLRNQHLNISDEFIKVLKMNQNLKAIYMVCGDKSLGFSDNLGKIFECLGNLQKLQTVGIKHIFEIQNTLPQLAYALNQMKKLQKLKLCMKYTGLKSHIFSEFMTLIHFSSKVLRHLHISLDNAENSLISNLFWRSFTKALPNNTLDTLTLRILAYKIYMEDDSLNIFMGKLSQNPNLSNLKLSFDAIQDLDGLALRSMPRILRELKYTEVKDSFYQRKFELFRYRLFLCFSKFYKRKNYPMNFR